MLLLYLTTVVISCASVDSAKDYAAALGKSILFYDAQRSGPLPANNPIPWRGDSALHDCVVGGWYDAGDHVKFGLPMAASALNLLWSVYKWKDGYTKAGQLNQMYDMIKWPLDYFLKAWNPSKQEFTFQVGNENLDHNFWGRPEDMTMARPCLVASVAHPGSDVAGETAAALALGSIVFKDKGDTAYSNQLLTAAQSLYKFANEHRGIAQAHTYASSSYKDELCVAGLWLYRATHNQQYLNDAKTEAELGYIWSYNLDNNQSANTAFMALVAADSGIAVDKYREWAVEQINYILGDNPHDGGCYSYEIGYGSKYPLRPHHRASSCPSKPAPCTFGDPLSPNPHVLTGALVGGPEENDQYVDTRSDYVMNEVACDYNMGFHAALAGIVHLQVHNQFPVTHNKCPCNH